MNSQIIPTGLSETITDGTITDKKVLVLTAETELVITGLVYQFPADPPNAAVVAAFTLPAGRSLFRVKSVTFTGTATAIYSYN